jgi:hypothetical protein
MHRLLIRALGLVCVAAIVAAGFGSAARAAVAAPAAADIYRLPIDGTIPLITSGWWQCPDTGTCSASPLRLWLPSFGGGSATVESGEVSHSCGMGCYAIPNGALITIRAVPDAGYMFTGWGGMCSTVHSTGCRFHMYNNYTAGATFDPVPSSSGGASNTSSDPVTSVLDFVVQVTGRGTVVVQGTGAYYPTSVCKAPYPCTMTRFKKNVQVVAIATGGTFLGWGGGRCSGTQTSCTFKNDFDRYGRPRITAAFS